MATSYTSTQEMSGVQAVYGPGAFMETFSFAVPAAGFALDDTVKLARIPANCALVDFFIDCPRLDSGATPTLTVDLGDSAGSQRYIAAGALARSATNTVIDPTSVSAASGGGWQQGSLPYHYDTDDDLILKIHAAPATAATSGTIRGYAIFWGGQNQ